MKRLIASLLALAAIVVLPWILMTAYVNANGVLVPGKVVEKHEAIVMPGGDASKHVYEVKYEYQPLDTPYRQAASHRVTPVLYRTLRIGETVEIRYSPSGLLRHMEGVGSFVVGSSAFSRLPYGPPDTRDLGELGGIAAAIVVGVIAYRRKSKSMGLLAAVIGSAAVPVVFLSACGLIVLPTLFWGWWRKTGKGYGWALLGTIALSVGIVYWRIPQPTSLPPGPVLETTATVRQTHVANEIWSTDNEGHSDREGGQNIGQPFQMLDLEFTPEGTAESIHVLDRIDLDSMPEVREGAKVPITYSSADPSVARVAGGSRNYARTAAEYLLGLTYAMAVVTTFLVFPAVYFVEKIVHGSPILRGISNSESAIGQWAHLPENDPRRQAFEKAMSRIAKNGTTDKKT